MASYTISGKTYDSFGEFVKDSNVIVAGCLLGRSKRRDKFIYHEDEDIRQAASLIQRHENRDINDKELLILMLSTSSYVQLVMNVYVHTHIEAIDIDYLPWTHGVVRQANIDPGDAERWNSAPKKKPYSEYTDEEKLACIKRLDENGYREDLLWDDDIHIRLAAYRVLGWSEEAKQDSDEDVRLEAYRNLWYTKDALNDTEYTVAKEASLYYHTVGKRADE